MSALISSQIAISAIMGMQGVKFNDETVQRFDYRVVPEDRRFYSVSGVDLVWPRSSFGMCDNGGYMDNAHQYWEWPIIMTGTNRQTVVTGVTKNSSGAAVGGVTVQLYNTATGLLVDTGISDSGGNYTLTDPNGVNCFLVAYLAGSPDTAGTTKNNLTGV